MRVSVVIATRNRSDLIGDCLDGLSRMPYRDAEFLIVDQSTDHRTADLVARAGDSDPRFAYIPTDSVGASRARNIGIARSQGEIIAFTDDDCIPNPSWIEHLRGILVANPDADAVFGRCLPWGGVRPGERPVALKTDMESRVFQGKGNPWRLCHGNNMAFRREALDRIGGFDERLGPGTRFCACEDADLMYRLLASGRTAVYSPGPVIHHKQFRHGEDLWKLERGYSIGAGGFYAKHLYSGDFFMLRLILDRWWTVGLRHVIYGMLTLRKQHIRLGWYRIAYSVAGMRAARPELISCRPTKIPSQAQEARREHA